MYQTSFAVQILPRTGLDYGQKWCAVYCCPTSDFEPAKLVEKIQDMFESKCRKAFGYKKPYQRTELLNMHVSVILDEAHNIKEMVDTEDKLQKIKGELHPIAGDVRLIVTGAGYEASEARLDSKPGFNQYDTRPWGFEQLHTLLRAKYHNDTSLHCMEAALMENWFP